MAERIQKVLAQAGIASRREVDRWLGEGRISVDGETAKPGDRLQEGQIVKLDGRRLRITPAKKTNRVLIYNKTPDQLVTRSDPQDRPTVFDVLPQLRDGRWIAVGRLDLTTSGLLILTTNGDLAHGLMHPSRLLGREYQVRLRGVPDKSVLNKLRKGVELDDGPARFDVLEPTHGGSQNASFRVVVHEGRNRIVRRLWEAVGFRVSRLMRTRYGPVSLPRNLKQGQFMEADAALKKVLFQAARVDA